MIKLRDHIFLSTCQGENCTLTRGTGYESCTPRTKKQTSCAVTFFGQKVYFQDRNFKIFVHGSLPFFRDPDYPENKSLFAGLIRQIVAYLPDNQGH